MSSKKINPIKKSVFIFTLLFLYLGIQEILLRAIFPVPEVVNFNRINYSPLINVTGYNKTHHLSNTAFRWISEPDGAEFILRLNVYGFRDRAWEIEHKTNCRRVIFVGDSFIEGLMANDEETIPRVFENEVFDRNKNIETLNLGVGAIQLPGYFMLIRDAVPLLKPDYLIVIFYANDFIYFIPFNPSWLSPPFVPQYSQPLKPRLYYIIENMIANNPIPRVWKSPPFPFLAAVPHPSNPWSSKENAESFSKFVTPSIADAMKKGRFNPHIVNDYKWHEKGLREPINVFPHLRALKNFVGNYSCKLFIGYIPSCNQVSDAYLPFLSKYNENKNPSSLMGEQYQIHARILENTCRKLNIPFLDFTPILLKHENEGERLYWNYDSHMKGGGYLLVGRYLYKWFEIQLQSS